MVGAGGGELFLRKLLWNAAMFAVFISPAPLSGYMGNLGHCSKDRKHWVIGQSGFVSCRAHPLQGSPSGFLSVNRHRGKHPEHMIVLR